MRVGCPDIFFRFFIPSALVIEDGSAMMSSASFVSPDEVDWARKSGTDALFTSVAPFVVNALRASLCTSGDAFGQDCGFERC